MGRDSMGINSRNCLFLPSQFSVLYLSITHTPRFICGDLCFLLMEQICCTVRLCSVRWCTRRCQPEKKNLSSNRIALRLLIRMFCVYYFRNKSWVFKRCQDTGPFYSVYKFTRELIFKRINTDLKTKYAIIVFIF